MTIINIPIKKIKIEKQIKSPLRDSQLPNVKNENSLKSIVMQTRNFKGAILNF